MKRNLRIGQLILPALIVLLSGSACEKAEEVTLDNAEARPISVEATLLRATDIEIKRTYTGSLEGERQSDVYAQLSEAIERVAVSEGEEVVADQLLFVLDRQGATSKYNEARSLFVNSEKTYQKMAHLYAEGAISESEHDAAKTNYDVNKASFEAVARLIEIRTPIAGTVTSIDAATGEHVNPAQKLATIASMNRLKVSFGVNVDEISDIKEGQSISIISEQTDEKISGLISAVAVSADPLTRAFKVEALVDNSRALFYPGMFVRVEFIAEVINNVLVIDQGSIITLDGQPVAYVISNGQAQQRPLSLGQSVRGRVLVNSGLAVGDSLITRGQAYLNDSTLVKLTQLHESIR